MLHKLKWALAFGFDAIIFTIAGIVLAIFAILKALVIVTFGMIISILTLDLEGIVNGFVTLGRVIFEMPVRCFEVVFKRVREAYDNPIFISKK